MLILSRTDVEGLLDLDRLVDAVGDALSDLSAGRTSMPARTAATVASHGAFLAAMPAFLSTPPALTAKLVSLFPGNTDRPTHQALICCLDPDDGTPLAVMDGTYITEARTAAGSVLAARLLARPGSEAVTVIGTGAQARAHALAMSRTGARVFRICGRDQDKVSALADDLRSEVPATVEAAKSVEDAVRAADIVCATTHAGEPVVQRSWLRPGTHVSSVGYNTTGTGEVDVETIRDSLVCVESRATALAAPPAGAVELLRAVEQSALYADEVSEIGEVLRGDRPGRADEEQISLYKSVGVAVQDAAAAALVLQAANLTGTGRVVEM